MIFLKRKVAVVFFCLCTLISTQQVNCGGGWSSLWSSSSPSSFPRYHTLSPEENQKLEEELLKLEEEGEEIVPLPAIPEKIHSPQELAHVKDLQDVILPSREQEYEVVVQLEDQLRKGFLSGVNHQISLVAHGLQEKFATVFSPTCIDPNKRISVEDQQRCTEVREEMMSMLIMLDDHATLADFWAEKLPVILDRRKRTEKQLAEKKRKVDQVIDQYERELE